MRAFAPLCVLASLAASPARAEGPDGADLVALKVAHEAPIERGRATVLSLAVIPASGSRLLPDGPLVIELSGSALDPAHRTLRLRDAVDPRAETPRFELEVRPHRTGAPVLSARITAWICRGARCRPVETSAKLPVELAGQGP